MTADILLMDTDLVPVGRDQAQHVEIARDLAETFNALFGPTLRPPAADIDPAVETVAGLDGRKMSKSYGNIVPMLAPPDELGRLVARIRTDSRGPDEPKDPDACLVFGLYRQFATPGEQREMRRRYLEGAIGYREAKAALREAVERELDGPRRRFRELRPEEHALREVLADGASRARRIARATMARVRDAIRSEGLRAGGGKATSR
jgi:tryptophanyl-tRNA synthetase